MVNDAASKSVSISFTSYSYFNLHAEIQICSVSVNHLRRPPVRAGWSLGCVFLKWQQGSERERSQEVKQEGAAGGALPSLAAGDTHTHTHSRDESYLKGQFTKNNNKRFLPQMFL